MPDGAPNSEPPLEIVAGLSKRLVFLGGVVDISTFTSTAGLVVVGGAANKFGFSSPSFLAAIAAKRLVDDGLGSIVGISFYLVDVAVSVKAAPTITVCSGAFYSVVLGF